MSLSARSLLYFRRLGEGMVGDVLARDGLQLAPALVSPTVAARLRRGIRVLEAWVRRVILLIALHLEHGLCCPGHEWQPRVRGADPRARGRSFRIFTREPLDSADFEAIWQDGAREYAWPGGQISPRPLLERLAMLRALIQAPGARAKRLAWVLARRRHGMIFAPDSGYAVPVEFGTEPRAMYDALGASIQQDSKARPPPLGPLLRPGPRVRMV